MVRQAVMAQIGLAGAQGQARRSPATTAPGSFRPRSPRAISRWPACCTRQRPDAALAAAARAGGCEFRPAGLADAVRPVEGGGGRLVTCGLWLARRRMVAAVVGPRGEARRVIRAALTEEACFGLVEYLAAAGVKLVATEALARVDLMPVQAARRGLPVWMVGDALVAALLGAAAIRDPARAAALLARLPVVPLLRASLRRLAPPDARQLPLL